ncbi:ABC transporter ATP-binding protein [Metaclostridioides mangenotii]|uniref:ABC transporter ATP-binding protein n=1 Tax=Metaclostridioides mangenotii TaxID=1540 RepID=UPI000464CF69|nr:ABC transporter ATP-binding protein [Clostridioides mangenotii]
MEKSVWIKRDKKLTFSIILNVIEGLLTGSVLGIVFLTIDSLFKDTFEIGKLINLCILLVGIFVVRLLLYSIGYTLGHTGGSSTARNIRIFLGNKIKNLPLINFSKYKTGQFINIITNDVNNYEDILGHKIGEIAKNITLVVVTLLFLSTINPVIGSINIVLALLIIPFMVLSAKLVTKYGGMKKDILDDNVSDLVEYINGIQTFRSYGLGGVKNDKINKSLKDISDISFKFESKVVPIGNLYRIIMDLSMPLTIVIGGAKWLTNDLGSPEYIICVILSFFISQLMGTLFIDLTTYKNLMISKKSMDSLAQQEEDNYSENNFEPQNYDIEFKNISFSYVDNNPVLNNVSFKAKHGELTAIVGDSGSGKSTILNLISKYYEADSGNIIIGGLRTKDVNSEKVLENVSMVYQDVFLFNDSIKNNIKFAKPAASDFEIIEACKASNCNNFITDLEKGYNTFVGENGNRLSGGEKQRISIARAILKDSPILLLDEATASLDIENELYVKDAISKLVKENKTIIMIAHNLSVIKNADNILVVGNGKILEQGSHEKLMKNKGKYYSMWMSEVTAG